MTFKKISSLSLEV